MPVVKLLCSRVGQNFSQKYGSEVTISDPAEAYRLVDRGMAEFVGGKPPRPKRQAAAVSPTENAALPNAQPRSAPAPTQTKGTDE
jgi:hypothetical protein